VGGVHAAQAVAQMLSAAGLPLDMERTELLDTCMALRSEAAASTERVRDVQVRSSALSASCEVLLCIGSPLWVFSCTADVHPVEPFMTASTVLRFSKGF
jgi:hypothetical protein